MTSRSSGTSSRSRAARSTSTSSGSQVAVVQADEPGAAGERALELARVVDLDERLQAQLEGALDEPGEPPGRMEDGEQQDEVRARRSQHRELDLLDHELLGQDRQR